MSRDLEKRLQQVEWRRVPPPMWEDLRQPLRQPLPRAREFVDGEGGVGFPAGVREKMSWLGDTVQRTRLMSASDEELTRFLDRDTIPIPPTEDREGYWGQEHLAYWLSGLSDYLVLADLIQEHRRLGAGDGDLTLFDFGCASGRVLRHFSCNTEGSRFRLVGSDINRNNIHWIRRHLPAQVLTFQNTIAPPLALPENSVDFAWAFSVFTHIDDFEESWLLEINRILRPGGRALLTVSTDRTWSMLADPEQFMFKQYSAGNHCIEDHPELKICRELFLGPMPDQRVVVVNRDYPINNTNLFHSKKYIEERWGRIFEIDRILERAHGEHQDGILVRKA